MSVETLTDHNESLSKFVSYEKQLTKFRRCSGDEVFNAVGFFAKRLHPLWAIDSWSYGLSVCNNVVIQWNGLIYCTREKSNVREVSALHGLQHHFASNISLAT